jgi:acetyltransferase-like isoleucine patch superfamily enzyme
MPKHSAEPLEDLLINVSNNTISRALWLISRITPSVCGEVAARVAHQLINCFTSANGFAAERKLRGIIWSAKLGGTHLQLDRNVQIECPHNMRVGDHVTLYGGSHYVAGRGGSIQIGDGTHIGRQCVLSGLGGIHVGKGCAIASSVNIYSVTNHYRQEPTAPILDNDTISAPVVIGDDVWIGAGVTILPGISVGDHAVIGAGAVVTRDVAPWMIVAGVPARELKDRRADMVSPHDCVLSQTRSATPRVA